MDLSDSDKLLMRFLYLFCLIFSTHSLGLDNPLADLLADVPHEKTLTDLQIKRIEAELRLQSMIIEGVEGIRLDGGNFVNINRAGSTTRDIILQSSLSHYVFQDEVHRTRFREAIKQIFNPRYLKENLEYLKDVSGRFVNWQSRLISTTARNQGILYALVKFISIQLDTTVPAIVMASGNIVAGVGLLSAPVSPIALFPFKVLKDTVKNLALARRLGLSESINQFKMNQEIRKLYGRGILGQMQLINAHFNDQQYIISYRNDNIFKAILNRKNYRNNITLNNVMAFLEDYPIYEEVLEKIKLSRVSKELKLLTLLTSIENHAHSEITNAFLERFKDSIFKTQNIDIPRAHRNWLLKTAHSKDFNSFYHNLRAIPSDLPPRIVERAWREFIMPTLAEEISDQFSVKAYRTFQGINQAFEQKIRPELLQSTEYLQPELRSSFINLIFEAMDTVQGCSFIYHPPRSALL